MSLPLPPVTGKKRKTPDACILLTGASPDIPGSETDKKLELARTRAGGKKIRQAATHLNTTSSPPSSTLSPSLSNPVVRVDETLNQTRFIPCRAASGRPQVAVSCGAISSDVGCPLCTCGFDGPKVRKYIDGICNVKNGPSEIIADIITKSTHPPVHQPTLIADFVAQYHQFKTNLCNSSIYIVNANGELIAATPEQIKHINGLLDVLYTHVWCHLKGRHLAPAAAQ